MSYKEAVNNLGTIAKSGTKKFLKNLTGNKSKDSLLIGQFGVGFYSAYIVAKKIIVKSRKAGLKEKEGISWESNADGKFTVKNIKKTTRGTDVVLFLKDTEKDLLNDWKIKQIIKKYSNHIPLPIKMIELKKKIKTKKTTI